MRIAIAGLLLVALGCGGSSSTDLDSSMTGTWSGPGTVTITGSSPLSFDAQVRIAISGQTATLSGPCLDRSGSISLQGTGKSASWQGSYPCPAVQFSSCAAVTLTVQSASATLTGKSLTAQETGTAAGCGSSSTFTVSMTGTKT